MTDPIPKVVSVEDEKRGPSHAIFSKQGHEWRLDVGPNSLVGNPTNTRAAAVNIQFQAPLSLDNDSKIRYDNTANDVAIAALTANMQAQINALTTSLANEVTARNNAIAVETAARIAADTAEATARSTAITAETNARLAVEATLQPIPTSSTDYRVGTVMFCITVGAVNNNSTIAGGSLRAIQASYRQWYHSVYFDTAGVYSYGFPISWDAGAGSTADPHFHMAQSISLIGTWKNISGVNLAANTGGVFVRTA